MKAAREGRGQAERQAVALPGFQKGQEQEGEEHAWRHSAGDRLSGESSLDFHCWSLLKL